MATLPGGAPYPLGSDFVADGDNAIQALATYADVTHIEANGDNTAQVNVAVAVANWVISAATSWGDIAYINGNQIVVRRSGRYAIFAAIRFGSGIAGRAFGEIQIQSANVARSTGGGGDDQLSVVIPSVVIAGNLPIRIMAYQGGPADQSVYATVRITRLGPPGPGVTGLDLNGWDEAATQPGTETGAE